MDNKRMCTIDEYDHGLYDDDLGGLIRNILDFPVESLDGGDDLSDDWASELGPIPSEVFGDMLPPVGFGDAGGCSGGGDGGSDGSTSFLTECGSKAYRIPKSFEAPSPDSVLVRRVPNSTGKTVSFGTEIAIPVRTRTKRFHSRLQSGPGLTTSSWSKSLQQFPFQKMKKKRKNLPKHDANKVNKCSHCEITKTPQWREGPMGPKTLCNACGVRYRSGRLFPEYRPAASPTFVPSLHSNWHRKVVEMRKGGSHG